MSEMSLDEAWQVLLAVAAMPEPGTDDQAWAWRAGALHPVAAGDEVALLRHEPGGGWRRHAMLARDVGDLFDLCLPMCAAPAGRALAIAHLGQSLDGFVATASGDSHYVNDAQNIIHLHRMRALCDAVVVGGATVHDDDPGLTTRLVAGPNPTRVVIDPRAQLRADHRLFRDSLAPTVRVILDAPASSVRRELPGVCDLLIAPDAQGDLDLAVLLRCLHERGESRVFIEGGGVTVSRFLNAGLLDRLHIAVAPLLIGAGRRGVQVTPHAQLAHCLRPAVRQYQMGADVLFDADLRAPSPTRTPIRTAH